MKQRGVKIRDSIWREVKVAAATRGITISQLVEGALISEILPPFTRRAERTIAEHFHDTG